MDIEEFERQVQPRAKRSRLEPFKAQIFELKAKGYANWQVREWLASNGIKVTQEAVRKFIKSREETARVHASIPTNKSEEIERVHASDFEKEKNPVASPQVLTPKGDQEEQDGQEDDLAGLTLREKRERRASQFIKDDKTNPLLKSLKGKTK